MDHLEPNERYARLAQLCRERAKRTSSGAVQSMLIRMADAYEGKANSSKRSTLFRFAKLDRPKRLGPHTSEYGLD